MASEKSSQRASSGNFADDPERASKAGRKGGKSTGGKEKDTARNGGQKSGQNPGGSRSPQDGARQSGGHNR